MEFFVYYLHSEVLDKYYIGKTNDLNRRITEHNLGQEPFTKRGKPWKPIGFIKCSTNQEAVNLETKLKKSKNKTYVRWFIRQNGTIL
jgi:putative endonuclease